MPVKSINEKNNSVPIKESKIAKMFGFDYSNYNYTSLMRLTFIAVLVVTCAWVCFVIAIALFLDNEYSKVPGNFSNTPSGALDAAVFFIILFACLYVALLIMNYYISTNARDIEILSKNWWWSILNYVFPFIFIYVSYFVWKDTFDKTIALAEEDLETNIHFNYEQEAEREEEVELYREKKEEILEKEKKEPNKQININGKPIIGNKKRKRK